MNMLAIAVATAAMLLQILIYLDDIIACDEDTLTNLKKWCSETFKHYGAI